MAHDLNITAYEAAGGKRQNTEACLQQNVVSFGENLSRRMLSGKCQVN